MSWSRYLREGLFSLEARQHLRERLSLTPGGSVPMEVETEQGTVVLFSSNDYLGLAAHPAVREAVARAAREWGLGPRGSPLVCGHSSEHEALECELAALKGTASALLFPTGYAANTALLPALADPELTIFSDALNHASIIDGCHLARRKGARVVVYPHRDVQRLDELLSACSAPRKLIVSVSLFSMEGSLAPVRELVALKERHGALLVVDEAHATLLFGPHGGGVAEAQGVGAGVDVHMGTLSKAFGTQGGFLALGQELKRWLVNRARPFIFSTALPLPLVAGARAALRVAREEPGLRQALWERVAQLAAALKRPLETPVVPLVLGSAPAALRARRRLLAAGFHVPAIRPPTVPEGTARLRITLSAAHTAAQVAALAQALRTEPGSFHHFSKL